MDSNLPVAEALTVEEYSPVIAYDVFVSVCGIVGNIAAAIFYGRSVRKSATPLLVTARSINDLLTSLCFIDLFIILTPEGIFRNALQCQWFVVLIKTALVNSLFILLLIGFDRYFRICWSHSKLNFTHKKAKYCLIGLPFLAFIYSCPNFAIFDVVRKNATFGENRTIIVNYCVATDTIGRDGGFAASQIQDGVSLLILVSALIAQYSLILRRVVKQRELTRTRSIKAANQSPVVDDRNNSLASSDDNTLETETKLDSDRKADENKMPMDEATNKIHTDREVKKSYSDKKAGKPKRKNKKLSTHTDKLITLTMFLMTLVSLLSFLPHIIVTVTSRGKMKSIGVQILFRSFMLHNSISPYIIGLINSEFRQFVWQGISNRCYCKRK